MAQTEAPSGARLWAGPALRAGPGGVQERAFVSTHSSAQCVGVQRKIKAELGEWSIQLQHARKQLRKCWGGGGGGGGLLVRFYLQDPAEGEGPTQSLSASKRHH